MSWELIANGRANKTEEAKMIKDLTVALKKLKVRRASIATGYHGIVVLIQPDDLGEITEE